MGRWSLQLPCATLLTFSGAVSAFYLPGVAPTSYARGAQVPLNVNRLTPGEVFSDKQLHSVFSWDYYHPAFKFCKPEGEPKYVSESLGSILFGDRIMTSPYDLKMLEDDGVCKALCEKQTFNDQSAKFVNTRIRDFYNLNWLVDGLPAGIPYTEISTNTSFFQRGFPLGAVDDENTAYLNNHYDIKIAYHQAGKDKYRVVGVKVYPYSRADNKDLGGGKGECGNRETSPPVTLSESASTDVTWTYTVSWESSSTAWATRWDPYLHVFDPKIHWFSLVNSAIIVVFLVAMVAAILMRALKKDFARYQRLESFNLEDLSGADGNAEDGVQEDSGWKLVHGDVFRTPKNPLMLSVFLGNGCQLFVITATTIAFALFGFLSPSNRGSLGTVMLLLWTIFGFIGGYVSARVYKTFGGEAWKQNIALTPILIPGIVFSTFFLLNLFLWAKSSSGAVPFTTMLVILAIWFVISLPLSFAGSWVGFKHAVSVLIAVMKIIAQLIDLAARNTSRPCQPNSAPNSSSPNLSAAYTVHGSSWRPPIRRHLRGAILCSQQYLVWKSLLHVWLPVPLLWHYDSHLRRCDDTTCLFSPLRGKLSLAMESVLNGRSERILCFHQCIALLGEQLELWELYRRGSIPWVQRAVKLPFLYPDG